MPVARDPVDTVGLSDLAIAAHAGVSARANVVRSLQHSVGNAQVQRLLASIQRCGPTPCNCSPEECAAAETETLQRDAAHPEENPATLHSPRFVGDALLEACAADKARLGQGARGESVIRVQQALADLGFDIGRSGPSGTGVDGIYGPKTSAAVRQFKVDHSLGSTQFGDVGPRTIRTLDDLFGTKGTTPTGESEAQDFALKDEEASSCPLDAADPENPLAQALIAEPAAQTPGAIPSSSLSVAAPIKPQKPKAPTVPGKHLTINEAVDRYKSAVNVPGVTDAPDINITQTGQFIWANRIFVELKHEQDALSALGGDGARAAAKLGDIFPAVWNRRDDRARLIGEFRDIGRRSADAAVKARVAALLRQSGLDGSAIDASLWAAVNKTNSMPSMAGLATIPTFISVYKAESTACGAAASRMAGRVKRAGGMQPGVSPGAAFGGSLVGGPAVRNRHRPAPGNDRLLGDVFPQANLRSMVNGMKAALDRGRTIHARVLSGVHLGLGCLAPNDTEKPKVVGDPGGGEHSIVIIGFDGDTFVFSDPDHSVSHTPEFGFGQLFVADGHLSTATSAADMFVSECGDHSRGEHRYQVITVATF